jgi:hypothetical protein
MEGGTPFLRPGLSFPRMRESNSGIRCGFPLFQERQGEVRRHAARFDSQSVIAQTALRHSARFTDLSEERTRYANRYVLIAIFE